MKSEEKPAEVSETKQAGEAMGRWTWVERAVWTDRMLEALGTGVKGGVQPRCGSSTLAEHLFPRARVVLLNRSLRLGYAILSEVKPPTGEPALGKPDGRFGGRGTG